jgi:DNA-directed RNA polymerase specialized sigma24 family protein
VDVMANNDISQRQLARESGISTITINKTVKRIRKKIREEWQRKEHQEV